MLRLESISLRDYLAHSLSIQSDMTLEEAFGVARTSDVSFLGVLEGARLIGLCSTRSINRALSSRYGHALYARKPVSQFLLPDPFIVGEGSDIKTVLALIFSRQGEAFYDDVVLMDREGAYVGVVSIEALLRLQHRVLLEQLRFAEDRREELSRTNRNLARLAGELEEANEELIRARNEAEKSTHLKSAFLANMSHEIRTPMNGILGMLSLLRESGLNAEQLDLASTAESSAETLLRIINDILDLSKIEADRIEIEAEPFDPAELIDSCLLLFREQVESKGIELKFRNEGLPGQLCGDAIRIRQILTNLIGNAVKFTSSGGVYVRASCRRSEEGRDLFDIRIEDSGIGISPEEMQRLFKPFVQADGSTSRSFGGTGLGLSISRRLAQLMDGDVCCESEKGIGSTFFVRLALTPPAQVRQEPTAAPARVEASAARQPELVSVLSEGTRVLVAEDNAVNQKVAQLFLERLGCRVAFAENGKAALEQLREAEFDLVLMDCQMPEMDGLEATKRIRSGEAGAAVRDIFVSAMTANAMQGDRDRCLEAGMNAYIAKPLRRQNFESVLLQFERHRAERESKRAAPSGA